MDNSKKIRATVYLYSGRPNPEWEFSAVSYHKLLLLFKNCKPINNIAGQEFILGYSGCMVVEKDHKWHAWEGFLSVTRDGKVFYYNDPERRIEKLIALTAPVAVRALIKTIEPGLI